MTAANGSTDPGPTGSFGLTASVEAPPVEGPGRPELVALLRDEIQAGGPITFARFMERALYEPGLGYYATSETRPSRDGDFLTAPELHPIFGHAISRQLDEMWRRLGEPDRFVLREYGAGRGTLAVAILEGLAQLDSPLGGRLRYQPMELPGRSAGIQQRLAAAGFAEALQHAPADEPMVGCVLANEFLDALPVHRVVWRGGGLREVFIDCRADRFVEHEAEPSTPELEGWFEAAGVRPIESQRAEVNLGQRDWLAEIAGALRQGYALIIDYGAEPEELYSRHRLSGTLRAFGRQQVSSDPYRGIGERDLTAHVDLGALKRAAMEQGLTVLGTTSQAELLMGCGLEELVADEQARLPEEWEPRLLLRSAVRRLLDPRQLGGFAVVLLGRDVPVTPPLRGLAFRLPGQG